MFAADSAWGFSDHNVVRLTSTFLDPKYASNSPIKLSSSFCCFESGSGKKSVGYTILLGNHRFPLGGGSVILRDATKAMSLGLRPSSPIVSYLLKWKI